ncbi:hypothetical protein C8R48DRAFT_771505 [Suillus tomentosus]|nr:hypothetical protein C8R48DRAFT_771505 [Suillus tomentosus]
MTLDLLPNSPSQTAAPTMHTPTSFKSSDSDNDTHIMASTNKTVRVEQASASKPPFLITGQIMPEALQGWEMSCMQFFLHKEVKDDEKVKKVAWGMQDTIIQDWYLNNQEELEELSFREFIAVVHNYWLPTDWADAVHRKILASVQGSHSFSEWAIDIQSQNTLLHDTISHLSDPAFIIPKADPTVLACWVNDF